MNLRKKSHGIGSKYYPGMTYLLNTVQEDHYFASKHFKWTLEKSRIKLDPSDMVLVYSIHETRFKRYNILLLNI